MSFELKELGIKDIERIKSYFVAVFTEAPWNDDWSDEEQLHAYMLDLIGNRNSLTLGFFENDSMVGLAMGEIKHWYEGTEYFINELCIKREEQGRGLGTQFLAQIGKYVKRRGVKNLFLLTERNMPAYEFYRKNGFIELENNVALFKGC